MSPLYLQKRPLFKKVSDCGFPFSFPDKLLLSNENIYKVLILEFYKMPLYLVGGKDDPNIAAKVAPDVIPHISEPKFGDDPYYDSGFTTKQLMGETSAPSVYFGSSPHWTHRLGGRFDLQHFSRFVYDFFRYFVAPDHFDAKDVREFEIPHLNSSEYVRNGDIYVRRSGPFGLLDVLNEFGSGSISLADGGLERALRFCEHNKTVPPSMLTALRKQIDTFVFLDSRWSVLPESEEK